MNERENRERYERLHPNRPQLKHEWYMANRARLIEKAKANRVKRTMNTSGNCAKTEGITSLGPIVANSVIATPCWGGTTPATIQALLTARWAA